MLPAAEAPLHLKRRKLEGSGAPSQNLASAGKRRSADRSHILVQFEEYPQREQIEELEQRGARVLQPVPESGLLLSAPDDISLDGLGLRWAGRLDYEDKISPLLAEPPEVEPAPTQFLVEFHPDVDPEEARALIREHGLEVKEHPDVLPHQQLVQGPPGQVTRLAEWDEVAYIFPASQDLVEGNRVVGCAGAQTVEGTVGQYVATVGEGWDGPGANPAQLGYYFLNFTEKLAPEVTKAEFLRAFSEWAKYAKLTVTPAETPGARRTVTILFASGAHGDAYPFDGPGRVIAHTYYPAPPNPEPIAGDMHLDASEGWRKGADIDLYSVVLHELGHALGLAHSDRSGTVMYPYYRRLTGLTDEDIRAIRTLYAAQDRPTGEEPPQAPPLGLRIQSPPGSPVTTTAAEIVISGVATGGTGEPQITWQSDRGPSGIAEGTRDWVVPAAPLAVGNNVVTVSATDRAQAKVSVSVFITRQGEAVSPSLTITSPTTADTFTSSAPSVVLSGTATHPAGIARVAWVNSRGGSGVADGAASWSTGPISLSVGSNTITVTAYEPGGRTASRSVTVGYGGNVKDNTAPSLSITSPASTSTVTTSPAITLRGTAADNVAVADVRWRSSSGKSGTATGTSFWTATNIPLLVGVNAITVEARDPAGNMSWRAVVITRR